jgi:hypothetical protein
MRIPRICVLLGLFVAGCRDEAALDEKRDAVDQKRVAAAQSDAASRNDSPAATPSSETRAGLLDGDVEAGAIVLTAPAGWERKPASSSFVLAEFVLPRAGGDDADGRLTVSTAGGTVEANIERWKGQFEPQPEAASQEVVDVGGLQTTIIDLSGTFNDQRGPFAPGERRPGYRMIAAVIPVAGQLHFIKATAPQKTIESHAGAIRQFIRSARPRR